MDIYFNIEVVLSSTYLNRQFTNVSIVNILWSCVLYNLKSQIFGVPIWQTVSDVLE